MNFKNFQDRLEQTKDNFYRKKIVFVYKQQPINHIRKVKDAAKQIQFGSFS